MNSIEYKHLQLRYIMNDTLLLPRVILDRSRFGPKSYHECASDFRGLNPRLRTILVPHYKSVPINRKIIKPGRKQKEEYDELPDYDSTKTRRIYMFYHYYCPHCDEHGGSFGWNSRSTRPCYKYKS